MEPGQRALEDTTFAERYALGDELGSGGMGVVHRAHDRRLERDVAIKFLRVALLEDPDTRARFLREARVSGSVSHPSVVHVFNSGLANDVPYIVTELIEGRTLSDLIREHGALPRELWLPVAQQILEGIGAVHAAGIVHRDIKPANVLVIAGPPLLAKLTDFGVAKCLAEDASMDDEGLLRTSTGVLVGTPEYMAPEQMKSEPVTPASDLYSLGLMFYRMCTGQHAFAGSTLMEIVRKQMTEEPSWPATIEPPLRALLEKMLAKAPEERSGLDEVRAVLSALKRKRSTRLVAHGAGEVVTPPVSGRPQSAGLPAAVTEGAGATASGRPRRTAAIVLAAVVLLGGGAARTWLPRREITANTSTAEVVRALDRLGAPSERFDTARLFEILASAPRLRELTLAQTPASDVAQAADRALIALLISALGSAFVPATPAPAAAPGHAAALSSRLHETLGGAHPDPAAAAHALDDWLQAAATAPASDAARLHPGNALAWLREILRVCNPGDTDQLLVGLRRIQLCGDLHPGSPLAALSHRLVDGVVPRGPASPASPALPAGFVSTPLTTFVDSCATAGRARWNNTQGALRAWRINAVILRAVSQDTGVRWTERWEIPQRIQIDRLRRLRPRAVEVVQAELPAGILETSTPLSEDALAALTAAFQVTAAPTLSAGQP